MAEIAALPAAFITVAGGGVTVTGGEPLLQPRVHRARPAPLPGAAACTPRWTPPASSAPRRRRPARRHRPGAARHQVLRPGDATGRLTGGELAPTLRFARRLAERGTPIWIRFVLVPGLTDDPANVDGARRLRRPALGNVERVDVLPFHTLGAAEVRRARHPVPAARHPRPRCPADPPHHSALRRTRPAGPQRLALRGGSTISPTDPGRRVRPLCAVTIAGTTPPSEPEPRAATGSPLTEGRADLEQIITTPRELIPVTASRRLGRHLHDAETFELPESLREHGVGEPGRTRESALRGGPLTKSGNRVAARHNGP